MLILCLVSPHIKTNSKQKTSECLCLYFYPAWQTRQTVLHLNILHDGPRLSLCVPASVLSSYFDRDRKQFAWITMNSGWLARPGFRHKDVPSNKIKPVWTKRATTAKHFLSPHPSLVPDTSPDVEKLLVTDSSLVMETRVIYETQKPLSVAET